MKKMILVFAALACSGLWAFGQTSTNPSQSSTSGQTGGMSSSATSNSGAKTTVDGCLGGSSGAYTLTDKASGTTYNLTGDTSKLSAHVGHEVKITGTTSSASPASSGGTSASQTSSGTTSGANETLNVTSMKHVASTCTAGK